MTTRPDPSRLSPTWRPSADARRQRSFVAAFAALAALVLPLTACGGQSDDSAATDRTSTPSAPADLTDEPTNEPTQDPTASETSPADPATTSAPASPATSEAPPGPVLDVRIEADEVTPNAEEIDVTLGEPLTLRFETDRGGELHVHSKPEQYLDFESGASEQTLVIETPGEVEVEEHDTGAVVAVLTVQ